MIIQTVKTKKITPGDDLFAVLDTAIDSIEDGSILVVTSKIISLCEGNIAFGDKDDIIKDEAEYYLDKGKFGVALTIKNSCLIPNAGIDESNGNGNLVLWPKAPWQSAGAIRTYLQNRFNLRNIGVIITDSKATPLRWGTTGFSLAHAGFQALNDYIGQPDLFGRKMEVSKANVADGLAAAAVVAMGEGTEQTPLVIISDTTFVTFVDHNPTREEIEGLQIDLTDDLYGELLTSVKWQKKRDR